ncbi:hypothetical protein L7F22_006092 [Adiantum nelumboides]|nr:hypothetical protein [Adiantum nelumboides]
MHPDQDFIVIIKWKIWYALELEEADEVSALQRKKKSTKDIIMLNLQDHDEEQPQLKKTRHLNPLVDVNKRAPVRGSVSFPFGEGVSSAEQQGEVKPHRTCVKCDSVGEHARPYQAQLNDFAASCKVEEAKIADEQVYAEQKPVVSKICSSKESPSCSGASGSNRVQLDLDLVTFAPGKSAQKPRGSECTAANCDAMRLKSFVLEQIHDAVVLKNGQAKMSDIETVYKKSMEVNKRSERYRDNVVESMQSSAQDLRLADCKRRTKRMRGTISATSVHEGTLAKCPVCQLTIPGDMDDADFNSQINLHVDSCLGAAVR